jgi:hypothetical protein
MFCVTTMSLGKPTRLVTATPMATETAREDAKNPDLRMKLSLWLF